MANVREYKMVAHASAEQKIAALGPVAQAGFAVWRVKVLDFELAKKAAEVMPVPSVDRA